MFYKFFVAETEKKVAWVFSFQLLQCKCGIIVADTEVVYDSGGFLLDSIWYHGDDKIKIQVWLVPSQDPDARLILQIDILMCFIYNISEQCYGVIERDVTATLF